MLIHLKEVDSTNNYILNEDFPKGTVVWADMQTAGRGRAEHSFASPRGGIYFSCLLEGIESAELLTPKAAVAVSIALEEICSLKPSIKWVNDIFLNNKKICGILCENYDDKYIAGIGINMTAKDLPEELQKTAGGISDGTDILPSEELRESIVKRISEILFAPMSKESIIEGYSKRLNVLGKRVSFVYNGETRIGVAMGINEYCNLLVYTEDETISLSSGEIQIMP